MTLRVPYGLAMFEVEIEGQDTNGTQTQLSQAMAQVRQVGESPFLELSSVLFSSVCSFLHYNIVMKLSNIYIFFSLSEGVLCM